MYVLILDSEKYFPCTICSVILFLNEFVLYMLRACRATGSKVSPCYGKCTGSNPAGARNFLREFRPLYGIGANQHRDEFGELVAKIRYNG